MLKAGGEGKPTVFLFSDNQIKDESFVEDINVILNTGDVPNLYAADEKAEIIEKMQVVARQTVSWFNCVFQVPVCVSTCVSHVHTCAYTVCVHVCVCTYACTYVRVYVCTVICVCICT